MCGNPLALSYDEAQTVLTVVTDDMRLTLRRWGRDRLLQSGCTRVTANDVTHEVLTAIRMFEVPMVPSMRRAYSEAGVRVRV